MNTSARVSLIVAALFLGHAAVGQGSSGNWDVAIWLAGSTGEELTNSFTEAELWSAGIFVGRVLTPEIGRRWWRGRLEYNFDLVPVFVQSQPQLLYGVGFEPVALRWNSSRTIRGRRAYIEIAGGALRTTSNLPSGDTSTFNFMATGGGGLYIPLHANRLMDIGLRWSHISNANLGTQNPEFNGIEIRIGYRWMR